MFYYKLCLIGQDLAPLVYESEEEIEILSEVLVNLKSRKKPLRAIIIEKCEKPEFKCSPILEKTGNFLTTQQLELARFMSYYYSCEFAFTLGFFTLAKKYTCEKALNLSSPNLNLAQQNALEFAKQNNASLLFADTGSGKTEIYLKLASEYLARGEQVLFLMPEISLTPQTSKRIEAYFKDNFFLWHSKIPPKKKRENLEKLEQSKALLVAGARSALFLPFYKLSLIIIDEEHDNSYKSNQNPRFNARDLALFLGKKFNIKVILGSATPSLTSFFKHPNFRLKGTFFESKKEILFDESELSLTPIILNELKKSLENNKQAIIFLPNRANFRQIICKKCGQSVKCAFCEIAMSLHSKKNALKCHYCNFAQAIINACSNCGGDMLEATKMGTAELLKLLEQALPNAKISKFDSDEIKTNSKLKQILNDFNERKIDILIGTSMLAKGHDYHSVDLSVILGLDEYLFRPNFKASEETLSLAMQVAGRAGRKGFARVLLQSKNKTFFEKYIKNYDLFLQDELKNRTELYPPFTRLLRLLIEDKNPKKAEDFCRILKDKLALQNLEIIGFGACAINKIKNFWRFYVLLRDKNYKKLIFAANLAQNLAKEKNVNLISDIDAIDFS